MGVAYKRNIDDVRESPALDIIHLLRQRGAEVTYSDPFVPKVRFDHGGDLMAQDNSAMTASADCVVIVTDHHSFDYEQVVRDANLIVDTGNALKMFKSEKIVRL
jgi:UDP-N-acetyl-D-glucosamine dehydrogenase